MKRLLAPYTVSIEVNSLSSISNEEWISVLYRLGDDDYVDENIQSEFRFNPKKTVITARREVAEQRSVCPQTATYVTAFARALQNDKDSLQSTTNTATSNTSLSNHSNGDGVTTPIRLIIEFVDSEKDSHNVQGTMI